jgi:hypothetical protein
LGLDPDLGPEPILGLDPDLGPEPALGLDPDLGPEPILGLDPDLGSEPVLGLGADLDCEPVLAVDVVFAVDVVGEDGGLAAGAGEEAGVAAAGVEGEGAAGVLVARGAGAEPLESPFAGFGVSTTAAETVPPATPAAAVAHDADPVPGPEPHEPSSAVATFVNTPLKATVKTKARATARPIGRRFGRKPSDSKLRTDDVPQLRLSIGRATRTTRDSTPLPGGITRGAKRGPTTVYRCTEPLDTGPAPFGRRRDLAVSAAHPGFQTTRRRKREWRVRLRQAPPNWRVNHDSQATRVARGETQRGARGSGWRSSVGAEPARRADHRSDSRGCRCVC